MKVLVVLILSMLLIPVASAELNCTDVGSDGIADNIILVNSTNWSSGGDSNCTADGIDDQIEINYALSNVSSIVKLLDGTYNLSTAINMTRPNMTLTGNRSAIINITNNSINGVNVTADYSVIDNITVFIGFSGSGIVASSFGINFYNASHSIINNTYFSRTSSTSRLRYSTRAGIINAPKIIENVTFSNNVLLGALGINSIRNSSIINNTLSDSRGFGIDVNDNSYYITVVGNTVSGSNNDNIKLYSDTGFIQVHNNTLISGQYGIGIFRTYPGNALLTNNTISYANAAGIEIGGIQSGNSGLNITFKNMVIRNVPIGILGQDLSGPDGLMNVNFTNVVLHNIAGDAVQIKSVINNITINISNSIILNSTGYAFNDSGNGDIITNYTNVFNTSGNNGTILGGVGNISSDPLFNDTLIFDFHLKSQAGRWNGTAWVNDSVTSPAIDAGDPTSDYSLEPAPNGSRINMGAYGNTVEASKSPTVSTVSIVVPANSWGMFNNWTTYNTTFSGIAANESNDVACSFYNVSTGLWEAYYTGYTYNAGYNISRDNSAMCFFNAETTITANTITPRNMSIYEGWNMLYVEGTSNRTIAEIIEDMEGSI